MITLEKKYVENNRHFKNNEIIEVKGLVIHSVGTPQPNPDVFARLWNDPNNKYLAQIVIGADKAYEVLPCTKDKGRAVLCYHVGSANSYTIGAEMTEPSTIKYTGGANWVDNDPASTKAHVIATYRNAVDIFAQLCIFHNLNPLADGVILSHSECCTRGIGTAHADVEHLWSKFGLTMDQFRIDVKSAMDRMASPQIYRVRKSWADAGSQIGAFNDLDNAKKACIDGYTVYDSDGYAVYPDPEPAPVPAYTFKQFVVDVQNAIGAKPDGIPGPETLGKTPTVSRYVNSTHAVVVPIQKWLYVLGYKSVGDADGIAGGMFDEALKAFQKDNGCYQDGEATAKKTTWQKLLRLA